MFEAVLSSFALVAASEMGDKTQLLAFSLAARFKRPVPILAGILVATLLNHALASSFGQWIAAQVSPQVMAISLGLIFFAFGLWTLKPDTYDESTTPPRFGPFVTTTVLFFLAEMGDKTQLATVALGARYHSALAVTTGTTLGMLASDGLAIYLGERLAGHAKMKWIRVGAAVLFFGFGLASVITAYSMHRLGR
jgi:putative Ca2+/H+ antiporter (TMEM165/GDT1 family)